MFVVMTIRSWVSFRRNGYLLAMEEPAVLAVAVPDFGRPLRE
jgi:hypothetical protein